MSEESAKEINCRNTTLDIVRGMAILIVVYGHAIQAVNGMVVSGWVHKAILQFQMPLFMGIAGFAMALGRQRPFIEMLKQKLMRLLLPYICWTVIHWSSRYLQGYHDSVIVELVGSQFWFLRVLFLISVCASIGQVVVTLLEGRANLCCRILLGVGVYGLLLIAVSKLPEQIAVLRYGLFFGLGYLLKKSKIILARWFVAMSAALFVCLLPLVPFVGSSWLMAILGSSLVVLVAYSLESMGKGRTMAAIGENSLSIYAIHWCLFFAAGSALWQRMPDLGILRYPTSVCVACIWLIGVWLAVYFMRKTALTRMLLLGEKQ